MLEILTLEHDSQAGRLKRLLDFIRDFVEESRDRYPLVTNRVSNLRDHNAVLLNTNPLLAFVEDPESETELHWDLLDTLQEQAQTANRFIRIFLISTRRTFASAEAQRAWLDYPFVVGYERLENVNRNAIYQVIAEFSAIVSELEASVQQFNRQRPPQIGSYLPVPLLGTFDLQEIGALDQEALINKVQQEYACHRALCFFAGGTESMLIEVRRALQAIERKSPVPRRAGQVQFPFGDSRDCPSANEQFDRVAVHLYGASPNDPSRTKDHIHEPFNWLEKMRAARVPDSIAPHVLLQGETGTGKTLLARWMHRRRYGYDDLEDAGTKKKIDDLFQDLNCGAIPASLIDSELFGGIRGTWTDLNRNAPGRIFSACCGTLFLDEIGEMPLATQTILLKFLDDGGYYPVGGYQEKLFLPVTVIAATNRPLRDMVEQGTFRRDLYERFRLRITVPSLWERKNYIETLADFVLQNPQINPIIFVDKDRNGWSVQRKVNYITPGALTRLREHQWSGNFRELEQTLWDAVMRATEEGTDVLVSRHLRFGGP